MNTTRTPWTPAENAALVRLYFDMLDAELMAQRYIKAHLIRAAQGDWTVTSCPTDPEAPLANRSRGSIEAKLMNATACHRDLLQASGKSTTGPHATMDSYGYRALPNYQASLRVAMAEALKEREGIAAQEGAA